MSLYWENSFDSRDIESRIIELLALCDPDDASDPANVLSPNDRRELNFLTDIRAAVFEQMGSGPVDPMADPWRWGMAIIRSFASLVEYIQHDMTEMNPSLFDRIDDELGDTFVIDWEQTVRNRLRSWGEFDIGDDHFYVEISR